MNSVKFTITKGKTKRTKKLETPASWKECNNRMLLKCIKIVMTVEPSELAYLMMLQEVLGKHRSLLWGLSPEQALDMFDLVKWMYGQDITEPIISRYSFRFRDYALPVKKLDNITCLEWQLADGYYEKFSKTRKAIHLDRLVATLVRPLEEDQQEIIRREDCRQILLSRTEVEQRAQKFRKMDMRFKLYVLAFFTGCKKWLFRMYEGKLFPASQEGEEGNSKAVNPLKWAGLFLQLSKTGAFGSLENLMVHTKFKDVCLFMLNEKFEADRLKQKSIINEDANAI